MNNIMTYAIKKSKINITKSPLKHLNFLLNQDLK